MLLTIFYWNLSVLFTTICASLIEIGPRVKRQGYGRPKQYFDQSKKPNQQYYGNTNNGYGWNRGYPQNNQYWNPSWNRNQWPQTNQYWQNNQNNYRGNNGYGYRRPNQGYERWTNHNGYPMNNGMSGPNTMRWGGQRMNTQIQHNIPLGNVPSVSIGRTGLSPSVIPSPSSIDTSLSLDKTTTTVSTGTIIPSVGSIGQSSIDNSGIPIGPPTNNQDTVITGRGTLVRHSGPPGIPEGSFTEKEGTELNTQQPSVGTVSTVSTPSESAFDPPPSSQTTSGNSLTPEVPPPSEPSPNPSLVGTPRKGSGPPGFPMGSITDLISQGFAFDVNKPNQQSIDTKEKHSIEGSGEEVKWSDTDGSGLMITNGEDTVGGESTVEGEESTTTMEGAEKS